MWQQDWLPWPLNLTTLPLSCLNSTGFLLKNESPSSCFSSPLRLLHSQAPSYISELLNIYQPSRSLRSRSLKYLSVPKCNTVSYGHRAFSVASAKLWNSLPYYLRFTENINTFKTSLKTFLFKRTFNLH